MGLRDWRAGVALAAVASIAVVLPAGAGRADATACAADLNTMFVGTAVVGADYQRATPLPDGRTLWVFQDAFVRRPGGSDRLVHNVGLVQDGTCFELLHGGSRDRPTPWIGAADTRRFEHWYWPLGATVPGDGTVRLFLAEMHERGPRYLSNATPLATWMATIDATTLQPLALDPAPDPGPALYGWSVASDDRYTYLYAHCYRQFGFGWLGHDACTAEISVARTSHDLGTPLRYWNGRRWVADPSQAVDIAPAVAPDGAWRAVNPMQVAHVSGRWIAVTKEGDWWGSRIYLDAAPSAAGPWRTVGVLDGRAPDPEHNTYFASLLATDEGVVIGLSNNRWDGRPSDRYRPTFQTLPLSAWTRNVSLRYA